MHRINKQLGCMLTGVLKPQAVFFGLLFFAAISCLHQSGKSSAAHQTAKNTAIDCGAQAVQSLVQNYVPQVTLALVQPNYQDQLRVLESELAAKGFGDGVSLLSCVMNHVLRGMPARASGREFVYALPGESCTPPMAGRAIADDEKICSPPEAGTHPVPPGTSYESLMKARVGLWLKMHSKTTPVRGTNCSCLRDSECAKGQICSYCQCHSSSSFVDPHGHGESCGNPQCQICYPRSEA